METLLAFIDSFAALNPILPSGMKLGLIVIICLVVYLPLSLLAWVLSLSFGKALNLFVEAMSNVAEDTLHLSDRLNSKANELLERHYSQNTAYVSFEDVKYAISGKAVQESLDDLSDTLQKVPDIISDREEQKTKLINQVNENLQTLSGGMNSMDELVVPELKLDEDIAIKKKRAFSYFVLFIPLLLAVIVVNTFLLNTFFDELMEGREILDYIPYSIVIALMFTFIEAGAGVVIGFQEREKDGGEFIIGNYILSTFCWLIISGLAFVEFFLYLLVGTSFYEEYDQDEIVQLIFAGDYFEILFSGGWLSILGPSIVLALYVFGHRVSTAYYDFTKATSFDAFKGDLNKLFEISKSMASIEKEISVNILELIKKIRNENITLSQSDFHISSELGEFLSSIDKRHSVLTATISKAEDLETPSPEIQVQKLSLEESKSIHRTNIFYLILLLASLAVTTMFLPNIVFFGVGTLPDLAGKVIVALLFTCMSILAGMLVSTKVAIANTTEGQIAKFVLDKRSWSILFASIGIFFTNVILLYLVFSQSEFSSFVIPFSFCLLGFMGAFESGRKLIQAINSWYLTAKVVWLKFQSMFILLVSFLAIVTGKILSVFVPIFDSLSYPIRFVFRRV